MAILFITSTHIGDAILSTGVLSYLHRKYPDDGVTIACGPPAAKVLCEAPNLETLHVVRKRPYNRHWWDLWAAPAARRWRVVVDLRRSLMPWILRAERRYSIPRDRNGLHRVELNAATLGIPPQAPVVWTAPRHRAAADALLHDAVRPIAFAPGASWPGKVWPSDRFADLAAAIRGPGGPAPGSDIVLIGAAEERETGERLLCDQAHGRTIDAFGMEVLSTFELLRSCTLMIGNDSAMMHLAAAAGIPTIGLFGPTRDDRYGPWGETGVVVRTPESVEQLTAWEGYDTKRAGSMMGSLTVARVMAQVEALRDAGKFAG